MFTSDLQEMEWRDLVQRADNMEKAYGRLFDYILVNENTTTSYEKLRELVVTTGTRPQWVPHEWTTS